MTPISRGFGGRRRDDVAEVAEIWRRGSVEGS